MQPFLHGLVLTYGPFWPASGTEDYLIHLSTCLPQPPIPHRRVEQSISTLFSMQDIILVVSGKTMDCLTAQKLLFTNCAINQEKPTIYKQEAPKTNYKYLTTKRLSINLNISKLTQN